MKYVVVLEEENGLFETQQAAEACAQKFLDDGCEKVFIARVETEVYRETKTLVRPA